MKMRLFKCDSGRARERVEVGQSYMMKCVDLQRPKHEVMLGYRVEKIKFNVPITSRT